MFATAAGCLSAPAKSASSSPTPPAAALPAAEDKKEQTEALEQRDAQKAWCSYLEALYLRASPDAKHWPKYEQCTNVITTAAPKLLTRTADCSMKALKTFDGDPFTAEYAAEVSRCGSDALDAMGASPTDLAPIVAVICGRAVSCGEPSYDRCRHALDESLGPNLERAIGAMNTRGRSELSACLRVASCQEVGKQVANCLEPIMDRLLWLPG